MKKKFIFSLFTLGFTSLISQIILLRELMISFYGNEFFLGLILAVWLIWISLGSFGLAKLFKKDSLKILLICHTLIAVLLLLSIVLIRFAKTWTLTIGQMPDLLPSLILAILIPAPLCLILGLQFTVSAKYLKKSISQSVNQSYLIESLGFVMAGLLFSFFLIFFNVWISISILAFFNYLAVLIIIASRKNLYFKIINLILLFSFALLAFPQFNHVLEEKTHAWRLPKQKIIKIINSPFGEISVSHTKELYNFYQNNLLFGSSQEIPFNESLAHFSLLAHPEPKDILIIGSGFQGLINEILKHNPEKIFYLEHNPWLIKTIWQYLPSSFQDSIQNEKVLLINQDGRNFLKQTNQKFDLAIINLPDPSTALLNRYYTQEFFEQIKNQLNNPCILSIFLSYSPNFQNEDSLKLQASIYKTIKKVFPQVTILLEEGTITFLASDLINISSDSLIQTWQERNIKTKFINHQYLDYVLTNQRAKSLEQIFIQQKTKINHDYLPIAYTYNFISWINYFHPPLADILRIFLKIKLWHLLTILALLSTFLFVRKPNFNKKLWLFMALAGFSLMSLEILLILAYQSYFGYLYYRLSLLITLFMLGLSAGAWLGIKKTKQKLISFSSVKIIHLFIMLYSLILYYLFWANLFKQESIFFLSILIISGLVGLEFVFINNLYLREKKQPHQRGYIYSADLFGSSLGALLTALFFIPILGILQTLIILIIFNLLVIILQKPQL